MSNEMLAAASVILYPRENKTISKTTVFEICNLSILFLFEIIEGAVYCRYLEALHCHNWRPFMPVKPDPLNFKRQLQASFDRLKEGV